MSSIISSLIIVPDWKEQIIERLSTVSERESILKQRKQAEAKLKRLAKTYVEGLIDYTEYHRQQRMLELELESLIVPEVQATEEANKLIQGLPPL